MIHIRNLKQALNHGLGLKKMHRVIRFNQKVGWHHTLNMNIELRKNPKSDFEKYFSKLINNAVFKKPIDKVRKHRDLKLVTTGARRNYLLSEQNLFLNIYLL